ncbi:PREDICTED: insulin-like growth factor-binding protein complex acid labile subunit [Habropoda laboriosa]|uniref:insulin-like growth factor-binding protein complex acid labile subunit n=1 Tax=Habropoda laboriosa TaxID=597456 RepID=UPI00083E50E6|nr:PREDICTED: insulin-like growth factor-binding protein complex acid labile subunit [Habropoda laboriosa]
MVHAWIAAFVLLFGVQPISTHRIIFSKTTPPPNRHSAEALEPYTVEYYNRIGLDETTPGYFSPLKECWREVDRNAVLNFTRLGLKKIDPMFVDSSITKELYLNENEITEISDMAFQGLPKLKVLSLSGNYIASDKLLQFKRHDTLERLLLDNNNYTVDEVTVDEMLEKMPRLRELSLKRDGIASFSVNLEKFAPFLSKLYLSGNRIETLAFLDNIPETLTHLHLDDNKIKGVNGEKLRNVQELLVNGNQIKKVSTKHGNNCDEECITLSGMNKLTKLNVSWNMIKDVAENAFADTKELVELDLSGNPNISLPRDVFEVLTKLEILRISGNQLTFIPSMCSLNRLKHLDLSNNSIKIVEPDNFCNYQTLQELRLQENMIFNVDSNSSFLRRLQGLRWLDLSKNDIDYLPINLIHKHPYLQVLLLKNNNIDNINELFNVRSSYLKELYLEGNPLLTFTIRANNLNVHVAENRSCTINTETMTTIESSEENDGRR